jgi:hypothetical protein
MGPPGRKSKKIIDPNGPACYAYPAGVSSLAGDVDANAL